ncbi:hypothetical protein Q3C01_03120 [Bradyrhizobium sp. UFLA05-109]
MFAIPSSFLIAKDRAFHCRTNTRATYRILTALRREQIFKAVGFLKRPPDCWNGWLLIKRGKKSFEM